MNVHEPVLPAWNRANAHNNICSQVFQHFIIGNIVKLPEFFDFTLQLVCPLNERIFLRLELIHIPPWSQFVVPVQTLRFLVFQLLHVLRILHQKQHLPTQSLLLNFDRVCRCRYNIDHFLIWIIGRHLQVLVVKRPECHLYRNGFYTPAIIVNRRGHRCRCRCRGNIIRIKSGCCFSFFFFFVFVPICHNVVLLRRVCCNACQKHALRLAPVFNVQEFRTRERNRHFRHRSKQVRAENLRKHPTHLRGMVQKHVAAARIHIGQIDQTSRLVIRSVANEHVLHARIKNRLQIRLVLAPRRNLAVRHLNVQRHNVRVSDFLVLLGLFMHDCAVQLK